MQYEKTVIASTVNDRIHNAKTHLHGSIYMLLSTITRIQKATDTDHAKT